VREIQPARGACITRSLACRLKAWQQSDRRWPPAWRKRHHEDVAAQQRAQYPDDRWCLGTDGGQADPCGGDDGTSIHTAAHRRRRPTSPDPGLDLFVCGSRPARWERLISVMISLGRRRFVRNRFLSAPPCLAESRPASLLPGKSQHAGDQRSVADSRQVSTTESFSLAAQRADDRAAGLRTTALQFTPASGRPEAREVSSRTTESSSSLLPPSSATGSGRVRGHGDLVGGR